MAGKGSKLSRAVAYFREADIEEVQYVLQRAKDILAERIGSTQNKTASPAAPKRIRMRNRGKTVMADPVAQPPEPTPIERALGTTTIA